MREKFIYWLVRTQARLRLIGDKGEFRKKKFYANTSEHGACDSLIKHA
jgi:hypothetical protein